MDLKKAEKLLNAAGEVEPFNNIKKILKHKNGYEVLMILSGINYSPSVRRWAIEGLATFSKPDVSRVLKKSLWDNAMTVRLHAARAISRRNKDHELKALIMLLDDESGGVRMNALQILGGRKFKGLHKKIEAMVHDEKNYIRNEAKKLLST